MNLAIAALALFPSQTDIPLILPGEDKGLTQVEFNADGSSLLLGHSATGSITRVDLGLGSAVERLDLGERLAALRMAPAGTDALALEIGAGTLHRVRAAPLAALGSAALGIDTTGTIPNQYGLQLDSSGRVAVVWNTTEASVVDIASMTELRVIPIPPSPASFLFRDRVHVSANGQSILVLRVAAGSTKDLALERIELATGNVLGTVMLPPDAYATFDSTNGGDLVLSAPVAGGTRFLRVDGSTGAVLSDTTFQSQGIGRTLNFSPSGDRVMAQGATSFYSLPLITGTLDPQSPGVREYPTSATDWVASGDLSTIIGIENDLFSGQYSAGEFQLIQSLTGTSQSVATGRERFRPGPFTRQNDRFCLIGNERVRVFDVATAAQGPICDAASSPNPGFGAWPELLLSADATRGVLVPGGVDHAALFDFENDRITGTLPLGRGPTSVAQEESGLALVGHEDGTLIVLDIAAQQVLKSFQIMGSIVEIHPAPGVRQAWLRTDGAGGNALVLVDTSATGGGQLLRIPLSGSPRLPNDTLVFRAPTLAMDWARSRCYALGLDTEEIEAIELTTGNLLFTVSTAIAPFNPNGQVGSLELSPDGTKLLRGAYEPAVEVYGVGALGLIPSWSFSFDRISFQHPRFSSRGDAVLHHARRVGPILPEGPDFTAYNADTGAPLDSFSVGLHAMAVDVSGDLVAATGMGFGAPQLGAHSFTLATYRSGSFTDVEVETTLMNPLLRFDGPLVIDEVRGRLYRSVINTSTGTRFLRVENLFEGRTQDLCTTGLPNATGARSVLTVSGSPAAGAFLSAQVTGLAPGGMFGLLVVGDMTTPPAPILGSRGELCIGGTLGRFNGQVQPADQSGAQHYLVNTGAIPNGNGTAPIQPGSTWAFQTWHRDTAPGGSATSNTSSAVAVTFR